MLKFLDENFPKNLAAPSAPIDYTCFCHKKYLVFKENNLLAAQKAPQNFFNIKLQ